ncbi:transporter substrate-binding domain-containing protein [Legionella nautarum]|nr:transporter substrate-binding domain-containing protein [Legionella nautarum]
MNTMRYWLLIVILLSPLGSATSYATIKIGTPAFNPPFEISDTEGFDMDLMRIICRRINEDCKFYPMEKPMLYNALNQRQVDVAIGGFTISETRSIKYIFSLPYIVSNGTFIVLKNQLFTSIKDLAGKKIGVVEGSDYEQFLTEQFGSQYQVVSYQGPIHLMDALEKGEISAVFLDSFARDYWVSYSSGEFTSLGDTVPVGSGMAIMALPEQALLLNRINEQIKLMESDGTYINLYNNYFSN